MWSPEDNQRVFAAAERVTHARARVLKAALYWAQFQSSTARARDLALACNRLREAQAALTAAERQRTAAEVKRLSTSSPLGDGE